MAVLGTSTYVIVPIGTCALYIIPRCIIKSIYDDA